MIKHIESKDNKYVKLVKSLAQKKYREKHSLYAAEGVRIVREALEYAADRVEFTVFSDSFFAENPEFAGNNHLSLVVSDNIFNSLCTTENSQGAIAAVKISEPDVCVENARFALILDGVSEPGNMGTVIRTAEAMGVDIIFAVNNCVDIYNPKTVRATMGSVFRMPFVCENDGAELADKLKKCGFRVCASSLEAKRGIEDIEAAERLALVIGSEARGISKELADASDVLFKIPMRGKTESLNASVAAGIAMYELGRKICGR